MDVWSAEEDFCMLLQIVEHGTVWSRINLPNRTMHEKRNRWMRIAKGASGVSKKRCSYCREPGTGHVCFRRLKDEYDLDSARICAVVYTPAGSVDDIVAEHEAARGRDQAHAAAMAVADGLYEMIG